MGIRRGGFVEVMPSDGEGEGFREVRDGVVDGEELPVFDGGV